MIRVTRGLLVLMQAPHRHKPQRMRQLFLLGKLRWPLLLPQRQLGKPR